MTHPTTIEDEHFPYDIGIRLHPGDVLRGCIFDGVVEIAVGPVSDPQVTITECAFATGMFTLVELQEGQPPVRQSMYMTHDVIDHNIPEEGCMDGAFMVSGVVCADTDYVFIIYVGLNDAVASVLDDLTMLNIPHPSHKTVHAHGHELSVIFFGFWPAEYLDEVTSHIEANQTNRVEILLYLAQHSDRNQRVPNVRLVSQIISSLVNLFLKKHLAQVLN